MGGRPSTRGGPHPLDVRAGIQELDLLLEAVQLGLQVAQVVLGLLLAGGRVPHKPARRALAWVGRGRQGRQAPAGSGRPPQAPLPDFGLGIGLGGCPGRRIWGRRIAVLRGSGLRGLCLPCAASGGAVQGCSRQPVRLGGLVHGSHVPDAASGPPARAVGTQRAEPAPPVPGRIFKRRLLIVLITTAGGCPPPGGQRPLASGEHPCTAV